MDTTTTTQVGWGGPLDLDGPSQPGSERNIPTLGWTQPTSFCNQTRVEVGRTHPNPLQPSNQTHAYCYFVVYFIAYCLGPINDYRFLEFEL